MYYIDTTSFSTATSVYTDELLTIKAPDGFYKFETGYREQLNGLLLNNIQCTTCIDCKQLLSISVKTGSAFTVGYTDCWGYDHSFSFPSNPSYPPGQVTIIDLTDQDLCVKNGSVHGNTGFFNAEYGSSPSCNITTELVQSEICSSSETPTGCDIDCTSSTYVFIQKSMSGYLENGLVVCNSNSILDLFDGSDLYYKINYNNVFYGVKISSIGVISELTYCNP
jgi:hypothetical protein